MAYSDDDESLVEAEEDGSLPDRDQDLKPRFHSSRFHGSEDVEDEEDDIVNVWNLRKCSAAALDFVSNVFGDEILPTLMPIVQATKLSTMSDEAWKDKEAAVLALGAIGEGCINGLYPHLPEVRIAASECLLELTHQYNAASPGNWIKLGFMTELLDLCEIEICSFITN